MCEDGTGMSPTVPCVPPCCCPWAGRSVCASLLWTCLCLQRELALMASWELTAAAAPGCESQTPSENTSVLREGCSDLDPAAVQQLE